MKRILALLIVLLLPAPALAIDIEAIAPAAQYSPRMLLTDTLYSSVTSQQMNIHWDQLVFGLELEYPLRFQVENANGYGRSLDAAFRMTHAAGDTGLTETLTFRAYNLNGLEQFSQSTILKTPKQDDSTGINTDQYLFIGDSITVAETYLTVFDSLMTVAGDALDLIGTEGSDPPLHEGTNGKTFIWYAGSSSPFWKTDKIDFQAYVTDNSLNEPDYILINLGVNDTSIDNTIAEMIAAADTVVTAALDADTGYPNAEFVFMLQAPGSSRRAFGNTYGSDGTTDGGFFDYVEWRERMRELNEQIIRRYDAGAWAANVSVCPANLWLDPIYSYPVSAAGDTVRSQFDPRAVTVSINYLHPNGIGHQQMAQAVHGHVTARKNTPVNVFDASVGFDSAAWSGNAANTTVTGSKADPWGGTTAEEIATDGAAAFASENHTDMILSENSYVVSGWISGISGQDNTATIRLLDETDSVVHSLTLDITSGGTITFSAEVATSEYAIYDIGAADGWHRFWFSVDTSGDVGDNFRTMIFPWDGSTTSGDGCELVGMQLEPGTAPGDHLVMP